MQNTREKFKNIAKRNVCDQLIKLIDVNKDNDLANLHLFYTVNRENYTRLLHEVYDPEFATCTEHVVKALIYLLKTRKNFIKNTIEDFSDEYELDFHSLHVAIYSVHLGMVLGFSENELKRLATGALYMDIGLKMVENTIKKPTLKLPKESHNEIQKHPYHSLEIIEHHHIHDPYIIDAIMHHHERYDGSGYPDKLAKDKISIYASVFGICDTFDALTSNRPYKKKLSYFDAFELLLKDEKMQDKFDRKLLQDFLRSLL